MPIRILLVDDEPLAQEILKNYLQKLPGLQLVAACSNAHEAYAVLREQPVDLLLLDINLPEISGMAFLRSLKAPPAVIFTTAYSEFAADSYELDAVDYLVKPIAFERFLKAIRKAEDLLRPPAAAVAPAPQSPAADPAAGILFVRSGGRLVRIDLEGLWLAEGLKDYVILRTESGRVIVHHTMKHLEELLAPMPHFLRVHKSYIVNLRFIREVDGNTIRIKEESVTIGNTYRESVHAVFDSYKLL
jgi:DNA-binding LytR/AlgR family response regulator